MKLVEVISSSGNADTISAIAGELNAVHSYCEPPNEQGIQVSRLLVTDDRLQETLDALQKVIGSQDGARLHVLAVEVALPAPPTVERSKEDSAMAAREAMHASAEKSARLDLNYAVLVGLSTIVASIGLVEDNLAVLIGAMVIAPLLGPNLAFGLATALGDFNLMKKSLLTLAAGIVLAQGIAVVLGVLWPFPVTSTELLSRTDVGMDSVILALASGAAAALSLTTGLPAVLVGVMVAVALLPPAAACGLLIGHGQFGLAAGAGLLLTVNVVCVNLACKVVFWLKGIAPRTWWEQKAAKRAMWTYIVVWIVTLALLAAVIWLRHQMVA